MNLNRMNKADLKDHAINRLGLAEETAEEMSREQLIAFIRENDAELNEESEPSADEARPAGKGKKSAEKKVKIIIHEQEGVGGTQDVTVSVNEKAYQIKRGHEVEVPESVVHVLENAVITAYEPNPEKKGEYIERNYRRFNFSRV